MKKWKFNLINKFLLGAMAIISTDVMAADGDGLAGVILRLGDVFEALIATTPLVAYALGGLLVLLGLWAFNKVKNGQQQPGWVIGAVAGIVIGLALIYYPSTIETGRDTLYDSTAAPAQSSSGNLFQAPAR